MGGKEKKLTFRICSGIVLTMRIHEQNTQLKQAIVGVRIDLHAMRAFLNSPKFTGIESDGGRKDWISTGDVLNLIRGIQDNLDEKIREIEYNSKHTDI